MKLTDLEQLRESLANHKLEQIQSGAVSAFYLKDPAQGRMMSTLIIFSPEGITLSGDLTPERNSSTSCMGYGIGWFSGRLSSSYLCEKFLSQKWVREIARDALNDRAWLENSDYTAEQIEQMAGLAGRLDDMGPEGLRDDLEEIGYSCDDGVPGWGYDPHEAAVLVAIQEAFAREYAKLNPAEPAAVAIPVPAENVAPERRAISA